MIIAVIFMLIFAGTSLYLAKRLYNVTAEAADMRGFYDGLARRYEPLIQGRTAPDDEPAPAEEPAPESEPEEKPAAVDAVGAPDVDPDVFDALVKILESAGYELKALPNGSPAPVGPETSEDIPAPADVSAEETATEPEPEKPADDPAPKPARKASKSKKTGRKPAAGRKGRTA